MHVAHPDVPRNPAPGAYMYICIQRIRGGVELPPLGSRQYYTFSTQALQALPPNTSVLPGDVLITTCTYDSREASNVTT